MEVCVEREENVVGLQPAANLVGKNFVSKNGTVKLEVSICVNRELWRSPQSFPHVTHEMKKDRLWSVRFHNGTNFTRDGATIQSIQTFAMVDCGQDIIRIKGLVIAKIQEQVTCLPFVQIITQEETQRILVTPETWFGKSDSIDLEKWAPLTEGQID